MYLSSATYTSPHSAVADPISAPPEASGSRDVEAVIVVPLTVPPSKLAFIVHTEPLTTSLDRLASGINFNL